MSAIEHEIATQPAVWRQAADMATADRLPPPGARVAVLGCGTSLYVAQAYAGSREAAGHGETDAFAASEFPGSRRYDAVVAISRSGTTTEVLGVLAALRPETPVVAVTADPAGPIARAATVTLALPFADERAVVQTRFATTVLALMRAHLGPAADAAEAVLARPLPVDPAAFDRFQFLGAGWTVGLASEAALKLREAALAWTEAYPAMEYRHGPIAVADARTLVVPFTTLDPALATDIRATGATLLTPEAEPLAGLVLAHRMAVELAAARGLDPDTPRNLTRSVVLT